MTKKIQPKRQAIGINFKTTEKERKTIDLIVERTLQIAKRHGGVYDIQDCRMDITACHCNGCPLDLGKLLNADDFNFAHDVFGIRDHIDRRTGKMTGYFLPRCSQRSDT